MSFSELPPELKNKLAILPRQQYIETTTPESCPWWDPIWSDSGIKNPFSHAKMFLYLFLNKIREEEKERIIKSLNEYRNVSEWEEQRLSKGIHSQINHYLIPVCKEYERNLSRAYRRYSRKIKDSYGCLCSFNEKDDNATLLFFQKEVKKLELTINTLFLRIAVDECLSVINDIIFFGQINILERDRDVIDALTLGDKQKELFFRAYFFYYVPNSGRQITRYSIRNSLEDANKELRLYDPESRIWLDKFDTIYESYKKWTKRQPPIVTAIMSKQRKDNYFPFSGK